MIEIRPLAKSEVPEAARIIGANPLWSERYHYTPERAARDLMEALDRGDLVLGAFDSRLLGFAWVMPRGTFGREPYLKLIAASPDAQSKGAGAQLLEAAMERLRGTASQLFLLVSDFNLDAQRFYLRHGFSQVGALPGFAVAGIAELVFSRRL